MPVTINGSDGGNAFTQGNTVGTVSQTAGVPTGAIIESGNNINGEYTIYADGTLICHTRLDMGSILAFGSGTEANPYRTSSETWTLPMSFVDDYTYSFGARLGFTGQSGGVFGARNGSRNVSSLEGLQIYQISSNNTDGTAFLDIMAIGRWF